MPKTELLPKKNQTPLVCWFRLYGEDARRVKALTGGARGKHNAIAYAGTMAEVARLEAHAVNVDPLTLRTVAEAQRLGINVRAELTAILQRADGPSAA